jgi:hypothetical protein
MVNGATDRVQGMYSNLDFGERNLDAVGGLGFACGLDGNPMLTAVASTIPILSLSLPVPVVSPPDCSEEESKSEHGTGSDAGAGHGPSSMEDIRVSGIPRKFHFGLFGETGREVTWVPTLPILCFRCTVRLKTP